MQILRVVKAILSFFGVDRAVGYTLIGQGAAQLFRPVTMALMVACLTVEEQGYQYTIVGLVGIKVFFEAGFGAVMLQFVGHEAGRLVIRRGHGPEGDHEALARVAALFRQTVQAYTYLACLFATIVLPIGWWMLSSAVGAETVSWKVPWVLAVAQIVAQFPTSMMVNLLAGCGQIVSVARIRMISGLAQTAAYAGLLVGGAGLYSAPAAGLLAMGAELTILGIGYWPFLVGLWRYPIGMGIDWWREVWPFQWKIALSGLSTYFLSQAVLPIAFILFGPDGSAQLGLTLGCVALLQGVVWSFIGTRFPIFASLVGSKDYGELDRRFGQALRSSILMYLAGAAAAVVVTAVFSQLELALANRFLPPEWVAITLATGLCWHLTECMAAYFQVHRRDPFVWVKFGSALILPVAAYLAGSAFGLPGMVTVMFLTSAGFGVGAGGLLFRRHRRTWQPGSQDAVPSDAGLAKSVSGAGA